MGEHCRLSVWTPSTLNFFPLRRGHGIFWARRSQPHAITSPFSAAKRENVMRRVLILISVAAVAVACAKKEAAPAADTTATAMAPAAAPAAAPALTEAGIAGTWKGTSSPMTSDSVVSHWTTVCAAGKCTGTSTEDKTTIHYTYTLSGGDSATGVSEPFAGPKGVKMIDSWTAHAAGDKVTGTGAQKLASKPDSVVMAYKFAGTRQH